MHDGSRTWRRRGSRQGLQTPSSTRAAFSSTLVIALSDSSVEHATLNSERSGFTIERASKTFPRSRYSCPRPDSPHRPSCGWLGAHHQPSERDLITCFGSACLARLCRRLLQRRQRPPRRWSQPFPFLCQVNTRVKSTPTTASEPRGSCLKAFKDFARKQMPASGLGCLMCAIFARQRMGGVEFDSPSTTCEL